MDIQSEFDFEPAKWYDTDMSQNMSSLAAQWREACKDVEPWTEFHNRVILARVQMEPAEAIFEDVVKLIPVWGDYQYVLNQIDSEKRRKLDAIAHSRGSEDD